MQRVVLLGASNLTLSFPLILSYLRTGFTQPVRLFAAHGHGRSYGMHSQVLFRRLPGIMQCDLWTHLASEDSTSRPLALLTDVGNDLVYGADVEQLSAWVEICLRRLRDLDAEIVMTMLPLASVERLSAWRYDMTRRVFFPGKGPPWPMMQELVEQLDGELRRLAEVFGARTVEPSGDWYGVDPIHIRRRHRRAAWKLYFEPWSDFDPAAAKHSISPLRSLGVWSRAPSQRWMFGKERLRAQPVHEDERLKLHLF